MAFDQYSSPEERQLTLETLFLIDAMLSGLSAGVRKAFLMSRLEGLTYKQIAAELNVSERTIKKYMAKAMLQCLQFKN
jgi:RNA polymerase sigma-70 factor (ECF subfamily)